MHTYKTTHPNNGGKGPVFFFFFLRDFIFQKSLFEKLPVTQFMQRVSHLGVSAVGPRFLDFFLIDTEVPPPVLHLQQQWDEGVLELLLVVELIPQGQLADEGLRVLADHRLQLHVRLVELRDGEHGQLVVVERRGDGPQLGALVVAVGLLGKAGGGRSAAARALLIAGTSLLRKKSFKCETIKY